MGAILAPGWRAGRGAFQGGWRVCPVRAPAAAPSVQQIVNDRRCGGGSTAGSRLARRIALGEGPARDLVLAQEMHAGLLLGIVDELGQAAHPRRRAGGAVMGADPHHAPPPRRLLAELLEFGFG